ncbi:hypothetical protein DdX_21688 [Ditylenchus destructor]|uniref:Uncharacterized protein n=1 Tax=Ditylenchus destructor TaxID=166010 RepID=A0AAD4MF70_9BILA|nr:hypothetical protein DdX_21688 [Ditylenchus destructor]
MSSMRSASSSTRVRTAPRFSARLRASSCTRPGVPTTTCGSWLSSDASCGPSGVPPVSSNSFRLGMPVASLRICLATWSPARGGAQHQRLYADQAGVDGLQQAKTEGGGLAAAGRGLGDHIAAIKDGGQALRLDRREGGVAEGIQAGLQGRLSGRVEKSVHGALYLRARPLPPSFTIVGAPGSG